MLSNQQIAIRLDEAATTATAIPQISLEQKLDLDQAYRIQELSIQERLSRNEKLLGYKLGFTSKAKMQQMGVHEIIWGRLTSTMNISESRMLDFTHYIHPRVEPEIAFKLKQPIERVLDEQNVYDYVDKVACALEVIDSRYENFKFSLEDVIADNCSSTAYLVGPWKEADTRISEIPIEMTINNESAQQGNSNDILGAPIQSLIAFSTLVKKYHIPIQEGMIILAGAATPASYLNIGDLVNADFKHLGKVSLKVS